MLQNPPRRWFAFRLRTLFVVIAVAAAACGWIVYCRDWIRQRHQFFNDLPGPPWVGVSQPDERGIIGSGSPWSLRLFGENGVQSFSFPRQTDNRIIERARRLFPEATIEYADFDDYE
jgi:hypothetical protein